MEHNKTSIDRAIHNQFARSFRWTLTGSIVYESLKALHCMFLLTILDKSMYGAMGSLFSLMYLVTYIADLGATNSIPPFLNIITKNKRNFWSFLINYSLLPHLPIVAISACIATIVASRTIIPLPNICVVPAIIIFETIRQFLRLLLHTTFQAKRIVVFELSIFFIYLITIWGSYLSGITTIDLTFLFSIHFIDSLLCVIVFACLTKRYYVTLPNADTTNFPKHLIKRITVTRLFNYLLRVSRNMFTSNFLTPLFAVKFGLVSAGLFYVASTLANSAQAIVKSIIGYSGNALLANLKDQPQEAKKEAFGIISQRLITVVFPIIICFGFNHTTIVHLSKSSNTPFYALSLFMLFIIISFSEFFFMLYEQFYIIEEAANKLFFLKLFELIIFYMFLISPIATSPVKTLAGIIIIRAISFIVIALNGWYTWKIKFSFSTKKNYVIIWFLIAYVISLSLKKIF